MVIFYFDIIDFTKRKYDPSTRAYFSSDNHISSNYSLPKSKQRKNFHQETPKFNTKILNNSNSIHTPPLHKENNYNYNNININVNNLIINNNSIGKNYYSPVEFRGANNSIFSKIGSDLIGKGKKNKDFRKGQNKIFDNRNSLNDNIVQNVIENLMESTKEKFNPIDLNKNNNDYKLPNRNFNMGNIKLNINNQINNNINPINNNSINNINNINNNNNNNNNQIVEASDTIIYLNSQIWEICFEFEIYHDNKTTLNNTVKKYITILQQHIETNDLSLEIFSNQSLNTGYIKLIKLSFIILIYLKFILTDFNYDLSLKSYIKTISISLNDNLTQIISHYLLTKGTRDISINNCTMLTSDFLNKYNRVLKSHKSKNILSNPTNFGNSINKNCEIVINHIRLMSNNLFKIGYFKPIHTICFDFIRLIDTYTPFQIANLTINNILFDQINQLPKTQSNKTITFNPNNILSLYGFNANIPTPFLPSCNSNIYTLVLDLDETLVHFFYCPSGGNFLIRPHCIEFLKNMSEIFEIAIFTAAMQDYADGILNKLDPNKKYIKYRLYRQHTSISGISFVKDLSKLGRDLNKVIIIDNLSDNFKLQPNNGLSIKTWLDDMNDTQLIDIGDFLKNLIEKKPFDVRNILQKVNEEVGRREKKNNLNPYKNLSIDKYM